MEMSSLEGEGRGGRRKERGWLSQQGGGGSWPGSTPSADTLPAVSGSASRCSTTLHSTMPPPQKEETRTNAPEEDDGEEEAQRDGTTGAGAPQEQVEAGQHLHTHRGQGSSVGRCSLSMEGRVARALFHCRSLRALPDQQQAGKQHDEQEPAHTPPTPRLPSVLTDTVMPGKKQATRQQTLNQPS